MSYSPISKFLTREESTPVLDIGTNEIKGCVGMMMHDGSIEILSNPVWRDYEGKMCWGA